jgi:hypothetical protein
MKRLQIVAIALILSAAWNCKDVELVTPPPPDFSDFSLPAITQVPTGQAVTITSNKSNNVVNVGEQFECKLTIWNMPDSLFAAGFVIPIPSELTLDTAIANSNEATSGFTPLQNAFVIPIIDRTLNQVSVFGGYKGPGAYAPSATGHRTGVVCKLIFHALTTNSALKIDFLRLTGAAAYDPQNFLVALNKSTNTAYSLIPDLSTVLLPVTIDIQDEYTGGN